MSDKWTIPREVFHDADRDKEPERYALLADRHFPYYYEIIQEHKINSVIEIGIKAGYSMFSMLSANPKLQYLGIDILPIDHPYMVHAKGLAAVFPEAKATIISADSQKMEALPMGTWDLAHVDADHSQAAALHDLELCASRVRMIVADDAKGAGFGVAEALGRFIVRHRCRHQYLAPNGHGIMLLHLKEPLRCHQL